MNLKFFRRSSISTVLFGILYVIWLDQASAEGQSAVSQRTFAFPAEATNALLQAAKAHDRHEMGEIFGPEVTNLLTGDTTLDGKHFEEFASDLSERCDLLPDGSDKVTLEIGHERWPFPIPLIKTNGTWEFDTIAGEEEIINRHIGRDEYYAIGVCRVYVKAQREYAERFGGGSAAPEYAMRFKSTPGKTDGLYWPADTNSTPSPLSPFLAQACLEGYNWTRGTGPRPFHGYFFKILTRQGAAAPGGTMTYVRHGKMTGGFALVAYPIRWGEAGIMTFIVNQDGVVYERSLGEKTAKLAARINDYNPDWRWTVVKDAGITDLTANRLRGN